MWFKKILGKIFRRNSVCEKCDSPSLGNLLCKRCQEYIDCIEMKKKEEIKAKEELKRRNWIKTVDKFLKDKNGRY